jgi:hypothetical protein
VCLFLVVIVAQAFLPRVWAARLPLDPDQPAGVMSPSLGRWRFIAASVRGDASGGAAAGQKVLALS